MANNTGKNFGVLSLFDPTQSNLIRAPLGNGPGWWAGAPSAAFDSQTDTFYLVYRQRQPRELGRGVECRIAASDNGISFKDIWALPKTNLSALSIDRACLNRGLDGVWRLYIGHVHELDRRWRISMMEANEPDQFDATTAIPLLTSKEVGGEGVQDPNLFVIGRAYFLLASYATAETAPTPEAEAHKHASGDIYRTGLTRSRTGAAISGDGKNFQWVGDISPVSRYNFPKVRDSGWDAYCRRISSLTPLDTGGFLAFYDGGDSFERNDEERTGLATTFDLRTFYSLTPESPALVSPYSSGCLRYVDVVPVGNELFYYYEMAREDGAHELRVSVVERD